MTESAAGGSWESFGLDSRVAAAARKLGWNASLPVQAAVLPHALSRSSLSIRAVTGSGKTGAYLLPLLHDALRVRRLRSEGDEVGISASGLAEPLAVIVVPTKDLAAQVTDVARSLCRYCSTSADVVRVTSLAADEHFDAQRARLEVPHVDVLVSTPSRLAAHIVRKTVSLARTAVLVVDEADLVMSFGYEQDMATISRHLEPFVQTILVSATMSSDMLRLQKLVVDHPVEIDLTESNPKIPGGIQHFVLQFEPPSLASLGKSSKARRFAIQNERLLLVCALLKLRLLHGKALIFAESVDACYRIKLLLEKFGVRSVVLSQDSPMATRVNAVSQFNSGMYDYLVTSDDLDPASLPGSAPSADGDGAYLADGDGAPSADGVGALEQQKQLKTKKKKPDSESGLSRGIDFRDVSCVLNCSVPASEEVYAHRIGRAGRVGRTGTALTLVLGSSSIDRAGISAVQKMVGEPLKEFPFDRRAKEALRYRVEDVLRGLTRTAVQAARIADVRAEILASEKLKMHFEDHPQDLRALRHDRVLQPSKVAPHLKDVPGYLRPGGADDPSGPGAAAATSVAAPVKRKRVSAAGAPRRKARRSKDPLQSFVFSPRGRPPTK